MCGVCVWRCLCLEVFVCGGVCAWMCLPLEVFVPSEDSEFQDS